MQVRKMAAGAATTSFPTRIADIAKEIQPSVLLPMRGSGNFGESGQAAFYTIDGDNMPWVLQNLQPHTASIPRLERKDIDLGPDRLAFVVDNVLTHEEADALAACAEAVLNENGHSRFAPGISTPPGMRVNEAAHWYPSQDVADRFLGALFARIQHLVPPTLDDKLPLYPKLSQKVAQFRYEKDDCFERHIDGLFPGQGANAAGNGVEEWIGVVSGLSMLLYLNDNENDNLQGGETRLWSADGNRHYTVQPKKGRALFFRRGSPNAVMHAGLPVAGKIPKIMALINVAYGQKKYTRPMPY